MLMTINGKAILYKISSSTAVVAILLLYYFFDARLLPFPRCPFYVLTHALCPGCGSQRALSALLHGQLAEALHDNVLLVAFLPLLLYSAFVKLRHAGAQQVRLFYKPAFTWFVLAVIILFWVLRNIPFYPFSLLSPV